MRGTLTIERARTLEAGAPNVLIATMRVGSACVCRSYDARDFTSRMLPKLIRDLRDKIRPIARESWATFDNPRTQRREVWHQGRLWECASRGMLGQLRAATRVGNINRFDIGRPFQPGVMIGSIDAIHPGECHVHHMTPAFAG